ncbi:MAG: hypothetical protein OEW17_00155 [Gemmatimonadota bacterium]|nr:hypothetical protein [Gemmatimonadota bacterium]MDH4347191.1 hypothetical protein [Gemmatimonadota bacterium]
MRLASRLTIILLLAVAGAHLARLGLAIPVTVGTTVMPLWVSSVGVVIPLGLAIGLWREARR